MSARANWYRGAALLAAAAGIPEAVAHPIDTPGFLHMSASTTLARNSEAVTVHVGLLAKDVEGSKWQPATDEDLWFQGIFTKRGAYQPGRFRWTDGARCPAAVKALRRLRTIEMPTPILPIPDPDGVQKDEGDIILDGRVYRLDVSSANLNGQSIGGVSMESNVQTDLAKWSEAMLAALGPCWSTTVPEGVNATRGSAADAEASRPDPAENP